MSRRLDVLVEGQKVGILEQNRDAEYAFRYDRNVQRKNIVSLTMPTGLEWGGFQMLHPPFQMNLPEGALLEIIRHHLGKVLPVQDDFDLLRITGRMTIGRVSFVDPDTPSSGENDRSVLPWLDSENARDLVMEFIDRSEGVFGISGAMPKVLTNLSAPLSLHGPLSFPSDYSIVKVETRDFPGIALVEHLCLNVARFAGLGTPSHQLSRDGRVLVVERFDLSEAKSGARTGFEDACALSGLHRSGKYQGSATMLVEMLRNFCPPETVEKDKRTLFKMIVVNTLIRNGDAHLKNFGLLYEDPGYPFLAPAFDLVTTTIWLKKDLPALSLTPGGPKAWPNCQELYSFGASIGLSKEETRGAMEESMNAVESVLSDFLAMKETYPHFSEMIDQLEAQWKDGLFKTGN